ncbi:unnamed protein product [Rhizoctonia solani]|uniref:Protein kinase domain-containing protein n=1 Tax=Rhizoctonia solani TaxID=456999 RepID=A0A8H2WUD5_9AGAM|nr:unnamed protein product [Rhizoctonia solani]CAE6449649.1 unnamed protein product [Rhizoctonia solani]
MSEFGNSQPTHRPIVHRCHGVEAHSVAYSPDGKSIASGSADGRIRIWDANSPSSVENLVMEHFGAIRSVCYSPLGDMVASGSCDRTILLWHTSTCRQIGPPLEGHTGFIHSVAFSPTANLIASGSGDGTIRLWDVSGRTPTSHPLMGHTKSVNSVAFSSNNTHIVSGSDDTTLRIWDIEHRMTVIGPLKHGAWVRSVALFPNGSTIASGADDKTIRLWDIRSRRSIGKYIGHTGWVMSVVSSLDGTYFASGASDQTVRFWDVRARRELDMAFTKHNGTVNSVAFSPCDGRIASCSADETCMIWNISDRNSEPHTKDDENELIEVKITESIDPIAEHEDAKVSIQDVFNLLLYHGCANLSEKMDVHQHEAFIVNGGGFGDIWMAKLQGGNKVSIKTWRKGMVEQCSHKTLKARFSFLNLNMRHQNIHELMGVIVFRGYCIGMVSEWMENGNLHEYILKYPQLDRRQMCAQVASGLAHMHRCSVVHGDLKALNVLVSSEGVAKLTDFGLSTVAEASLAFSETSNMTTGSTRWAAPEQLESEDNLPKSKQSDVYALGMTMLEIFTGAVPYAEHQRDYQVIKRVVEGILPPRPMGRLKKAAYGNSVWDLLVSCWSRDPVARPSAREVHGSLDLMPRADYRQQFLSSTRNQYPAEF